MVVLSKLWQVIELFFGLDEQQEDVRLFYPFQAMQQQVGAELEIAEHLCSATIPKDVPV